jgi:hypothetical protein
MGTNWEEFDEAFISEAASFPKSRRSTILAPPTQRRYEAVEKEFNESLGAVIFDSFLLAAF